MWILIISICVCISLGMSLVFCLCWRKRNPKDEWLGIDGMVTQKNPDENVNHLPSAASCVDGIFSGEPVENKRNTISNTRRSLPDIPSDMTGTVNWEQNGDNSSEHYATLGQYQNAAKNPGIINGPETRPSISQHSSISQADDGPYERVKYDKIKSKEHPYAQVQSNGSRPVLYEEGSSNVEERVNLLRVDAPSTSSDLGPLVRSRRSSAHSEVGLDIPAATAVAGGIAANFDLPYMTPPVTQANFSGDSQDSSKGYTSISVREPLASILAQTKEINKEKRPFDVHYSTVSDDSDDVYTTIPDPNNQIYTSESETYARIPPLPVTIKAEINHPPPERRSVDREEADAERLYEAPPQSALPSVDSLRHVTSHSHTHSRQASSSSSIANLGSPKPEKRQANSPLPPPPTTTNFDFHGDKIQVVRNLDDLYAKVHKSKRDDVHEDRLSEKSSLGNSTVVAKSLFGEEPIEIKREHNYETLKKSPRNSSDPGYEKIKGGSDCEPGYASINGPESLASSSDPGYEVLRGRAPSDIDPNYEQLRHRISNASDPGYSRVRERINNDYSVVNKKKKLETKDFPTDVAGPQLEEPNYESMPSECNDPNYAKLSGSDTDPNYESVTHSDPNYETVRDLKPPHYERLEEDSSRTNSEISDYEKMKSNNISMESSNSASRTTDSEPPYERLQNDSEGDLVGYQKVGRPKEATSSGSSGNEFGQIQNEVIEGDMSENIHEEDVVVQV